MEIERLTSKERTTIPVRELREMFGVRKVESYWIIHNKPIKTITVAGKIRIDLASLEEWYAGQFHYKKVNGPPPGAKWTAFTLSVQEVADILGISTSSVYCLLQKGIIETAKVDNRTRIYTESFNQWYLHQTRYEIREDYIGGIENGIHRQEEE